ncbi:MAG: DUF5666 domain-containing protein [Terracidiphilus sp.]
MNRSRLFAAAVLFAALAAPALAQEAPAPLPGEARGAGRGGWAGRMGQGITGTVTEAVTDHFTVKTDSGAVYTVHFSVNTRILKQSIERRAQGQGGPDRGHDRSQDRGPARSQGGEGRGPGVPQEIKAAEIKVGDTILAAGETDEASKSVDAVVVLLLDPERAKQLRELEASYGKTWLAGRVTAIQEAKVTIEGMQDKAAHAFVADENTAFRKRREPITLADIQVGDMVRVEGAVKDGVFVATSVAVMGMPPGGTPVLGREAVPSPAPAPQPK